MKVYFQYWIMGVICFACLWPVDNELGDQEIALSRPPSFCTKSFIDSLYRDNQPDTFISLSIYNFSSHSNRIPLKQKRKTIDEIVKEHLPYTKHRYISGEGNYWKKNKQVNDLVSVKCVSCQYNDFYFTDVDKDGDLDIIYSSLVNDYANDDSNETLLFRNHKGKYEKHGIPGFVYDIVFQATTKDAIVFKLASLGCCDDTNYHFYSDTLFTKSWKFSRGKVFEFKHNEVEVQYPAKDYL